MSSFIHSPAPALSPASPDISCWVVTDGKIGTENQCIGLAHALGCQPVIKRVVLRPFWRIFTPFIKLFDHLAFSPRGDAIKPPYPQLIIASGRRSLPAVFAARKACGDKITIVQIQNPTCNLKWFDLVIAPAHDRLASKNSKNVLQTLGALHKVTSHSIESAVTAQRARFGLLPAPYTAVLLGGSNAIYKFDETQMDVLCQQLERALQSTSGSLLITASRRTGDKNLQILKTRLGQHPRVWIWDNTGDNPYMALLGMAEQILVTADSVSMMSEAASTGKPIYVIPLKGHSAKFARFHKGFAERGITRPFTGTLETWHYAPLIETEDAAAAVRAILHKKLKLNETQKPESL